MEKQKVMPDIPALAGAKNEKKLSRLTTIQAIEAKLKTMEKSSSCSDFEINDKPTISSSNSVYYQMQQTKVTKYKSFERHRQRPYTRSKWK